MTRVLLVDDFKPFRTFVTSLLGGNGYVFYEASDGLQALEKAQERQPDLILLDIGLPKLNGLDVARRLRDLVPSSKVVFLTQENSVEVIEAAFALGAWGLSFPAEASGRTFVRSAGNVLRMQALQLF